MSPMFRARESVQYREADRLYHRKRVDEAESGLAFQRRTVYFGGYEFVTRDD